MHQSASKNLGWSRTGWVEGKKRGVCSPDNATGVKVIELGRWPDLLPTEEIYLFPRKNHNPHTSASFPGRKHPPLTSGILTVPRTRVAEQPALGVGMSPSTSRVSGSSHALSARSKTQWRISHVGAPRSRSQPPNVYTQPANSQLAAPLRGDSSDTGPTGSQSTGMAEKKYWTGVRSAQTALSVILGKITSTLFTRVWPGLCGMARSCTSAWHSPVRRGHPVPPKSWATCSPMISALTSRALSVPLVTDVLRI